MRADAQTTRHAVFVEGFGRFESTRQAFVALGLPLGGHIRFRLKVKDDGHAVFKHGGKSYSFSLVAAVGSGTVIRSPFEPLHALGNGVAAKQP